MFFKLKNNFLKVLVLLFLILLIYIFNISVIRPFPFFKVDYVYSLKEFDNLPSKDEKSFYEINIEKQNIPLRLKKRLDEYLYKDLFEKIKISTEITREIQEISVGNEVKFMTNILENEKKYIEICSESAKIFVSLMSYLNVTARVLWTNGHTLAEIWDGNNWIMTDTLSNVYATSVKTKKYLSYSQTVELYPNVVFKQITKKKYSLYEYNSNKETLHNIVKKNKLMFLMSNKDIVSFHTTNKKINRVVNSLNNKNYYKAKQFMHSKNSKKVGNLGINIYKRFLN